MTVLAGYVKNLGFFLSNLLTWQPLAKTYIKKIYIYIHIYIYVYTIVNIARISISSFDWTLNGLLAFI